LTAHRSLPYSMKHRTGSARQASVSGDRRATRVPSTAECSVFSPSATLGLAAGRGHCPPGPPRSSHLSPGVFAEARRNQESRRQHDREPDPHLERDQRQDHRQGSRRLPERRQHLPVRRREDLLSPHFIDDTTLPLLSAATDSLTNLELADLYSRWLQAREAAIIQEIRRVCGYRITDRHDGEDLLPDEVAEEHQSLATA